MFLKTGNNNYMLNPASLGSKPTYVCLFMSVMTQTYWSPSCFADDYIRAFCTVNTKHQESLVFVVGQVLQHLKPDLRNHRKSYSLHECHAWKIKGIKSWKWCSYKAMKLQWLHVQIKASVTLCLVVWSQALQGNDNNITRDLTLWPLKHLCSFYFSFNWLHINPHSSTCSYREWLESIQTGSSVAIGWLTWEHDPFKGIELSKQTQSIIICHNTLRKHLTHAGIMLLVKILE